MAVLSPVADRADQIIGTPVHWEEMARKFRGLARVIKADLELLLEPGTTIEEMRREIEFMVAVLAKADG